MALITLNEYAERHGKTRATARQKAIRGGFQTAQKVGNEWFIDEDEPYLNLHLRESRDEIEHHNRTCRRK